MPCICLQEFESFGRSIAVFALLGIPAAIVNSGLKYMQKKIELAFQVGCHCSQGLWAGAEDQGTLWMLVYDG